ncbi:MAG: hypothetical protein OXQ94_14330 [Gemmatimonadota bacterium]|nr:hypothetical protein [Gemmatimonadota bacterium]MDE2872852.1 hypothetical protein [Gemmatimonadota bacterium]
MRANRFTLMMAAILALGVVACEPHRNPSGGRTEVTPRVDEEGVLLLDGLGDLGPHIQAAMGTAEDRAARAAYSPEDWPLWPGDVVSNGRLGELDGEFGSWLGVRHPFWVGDMVFGARWTFSHEDNGSFWPDMEYIGHFPEKTKHEDWPEHLPAHLLTRNLLTAAGLAEIGESVFKLRGGSLTNIEELKLIWTRARWLEGYTGEEDQ